MELTVQIPDDVAQRLSAAGGDLSRRALEALVAEEYKRGHLTGWIVARGQPLRLVSPLRADLILIDGRKGWPSP